MFVAFDSLPAEARIWIFQSNRLLTGDETKVAESRLRSFTDEWAVHGTPLRTSYTIRYDHFIILAADESEQNASGCSIDSSVRSLKEIEEALGIQLFDRNMIAFLSHGKVVLIPMTGLKQNFQDGTLNEDTLTFNNLVSTKGELEKGWLVPAGATWLKRYMHKPLAKVK
jgi:hypothetical protein